MERGTAEGIATVALLLLWLYYLFGFAISWIVKYYRDDLKPVYRIWSAPSWRDIVFMVGVWILSGTFMAFISILEQPVVSGINLAESELSGRLLFWASVEEVARAGFFDMFRGSLGWGVWINSIVFGVSHLHDDVERMMSTPLYAVFFPLAAMAFGVASIVILLRVGLIWAILVHFCVNTFRLVLLTPDGVVNYVIFFVSVGLLIYISLLYLRNHPREVS